MKNKVWKKFQFQTESNKFYWILAESDFSKDDGVKLNPYKDSSNFLDKEVVVAKDLNLNDLPCFNIRNTDIGVFIEVYSLNSTEIHVIDNVFNMNDALDLILKLSQFNYVSLIKYIKFKYGFKNEYLFYDL